MIIRKNYRSKPRLLGKTCLKMLNISGLYNKLKTKFSMLFGSLFSMGCHQCCFASWDIIQEKSLFLEPASKNYRKLLRREIMVQNQNPAILNGKKNQQKALYTENLQAQARVLHVIGVMNRGGAEAMIMNLYRAMDRNKVQFDFVENTEEKGVFEQEIRELGGNVYHCPKFNGNIKQYMDWWQQFFTEQKNTYVAVHGHIGSTAAMYLSVAKRFGITTIAHSHSTYTKSFNLKQFEYQLLSYPTRYISDYFFACSKKAGISRYGKKKQVTVINNAIDTNLYKFNAQIRNEVRQELGIDDRTVFGHVGRFTGAKNHKFLLEVFKKIHDEKPDSILLLIGDGPLRSEIENQIEELQLNEDVILLGVRDDVGRLMQGLDLMIFPSVFEGLPVTLVEAQCSGLRCLISDRISQESILISELMTQISLDNVIEWAQKAIQLSVYTRRSYENEIKNAGFDIQETAKWLEDYYLTKGTHYE